jgi:HlyD family secretion protein
MPRDIILAPGMPADVLILGRARSPLDYFLSPLFDSMRHALRED